MPSVATHDILDTAIASGSFTTLVKAVEAADLADALRSQGPYTLFAPTDEAFKQIPKSTLDAVMDDKTQLQTILMYHVVPGKLMSHDVADMTSLKTMEGRLIHIDVREGCKINDACVCQTDVECSNGIIHVIDSVLMPD